MGIFISRGRGPNGRIFDSVFIGSPDIPILEVSEKRGSALSIAISEEVPFRRKIAL